jgi:hypothetical protein
MAIDRLLEKINEERWKDVVDDILQLQFRIEDELKSKLFMYCPSEKAYYYFNSLKIFGETVIEKFPSIITDIEEAGKCYAVGRNTAAVFHLCRVVEVGLRALGKSLNIPELNPTWETILKKCDVELSKPIKDRAVLWKTDDIFFSEATANLRAVKSAWRNPTMHVGSKYTDEEAENIFSAIKGFMKHLAVKLSE